MESLSTVANSGSNKDGMYIVPLALGDEFSVCKIGQRRWTIALRQKTERR